MLERSSVILHLTRALLGEVTPSLRAVQFELCNRSIKIFCFFDGEICDEDRNSMSCVAAEVMADLPEAAVREHCLRIDLPEPVPTQPGHHFLFARKE